MWKTNHWSKTNTINHLQIVLLHGRKASTMKMNLGIILLETDCNQTIYALRTMTHLMWNVGVINTNKNMVYAKHVTDVHGLYLFVSAFYCFILLWSY